MEASVSIGLNYPVNPDGEFAVEEALRIKERLGSSEVVVMSVRPERVEAAVRAYLEMNVDHGIIISETMVFNAYDADGNDIPNGNPGGNPDMIVDYILIKHK